MYNHFTCGTVLIYIYVYQIIYHLCTNIYLDCGGIVENRGGAITMMHMVEEFEPDGVFDCIWLFRTIHKYTYNSKSQNLYMKVIMLKDLGENEQCMVLNLS